MNWKQELFEYMKDEHNVTLLDSDMNEVRRIIIGEEQYLKEENEIYKTITMPDKTAIEQISKKQLEIISKMNDGWIFIIGQSEITGRQFYCISKGFDNIYFRSTVFSNLLNKELIYQSYDSHDYILTNKAKNYLKK